MIPGMAASKKAGTIYFIQERNTKFIKIGIAANALKRFQDIQGGAPGILDLLAIKPGTYREEHILHMRFENLRVNGEWFKPNADLLDFIEKAAEENSDELNRMRVKLEEIKSRYLTKEALEYHKATKFDSQKRIQEIFGIEVLLTPQELAILLRISEKQITRWIKDPEKNLPSHIEFHGCIRFRRSDIKRWIKKQEAMSARNITQNR